MRTYDRMPDEIILPTGEILKAVIGGTLENKPFCDVYNTFGSEERDRIIAEAKKRKLKYRTIGVLTRRLRGRYDLHQRLYRPNVWMYVETGNVFTGYKGQFQARTVNASEIMDHPTQSLSPRDYIGVDPRDEHGYVIKGDGIE